MSCDSQFNGMGKGSSFLRFPRFTHDFYVYSIHDSPLDAGTTSSARLVSGGLILDGFGFMFLFKGSYVSCGLQIRFRDSFNVVIGFPFLGFEIQKIGTCTTIVGAFLEWNEKIGFVAFAFATFEFLLLDWRE